MKKIICALLLLLAVNSWAACEQRQFANWRWNCNGTTRSIVCRNSFSFSTGCSNGCSTIGFFSDGGTKYCSGGVVTSRNCNYFGDNFDPPRSGMFSGYYIACDTQCEADSVANYASCIAQGNRWENCECVQVASADSLLYVCNDSPTPDGTSYQYKLYAINMHFENGTATTACGVSASLVGGDGYKQYCPVVRSGTGTCQSNGLGNVPPQECSDPSCKDDPLPKADCYAVVGSKCYMKDVYSGNTFSCECDGSCQQAIVNLVSGNCRNPYPPPSSSGSGGGGDSSGSGGGDPSSSGSGGGGDSSGSGSGDPSSSGSEGGSGIYTEQLNQIIANTQGIFNNTSDISQWTQTTMNNTTDIKNNLSDIGIDVSHIRSHTQGIESNTGSINSKLSTTNSLLQSLNNKDWSPQINVNPPEVNIGGDTNIVNVTVGGDTNIINVQGDTAKSGAAILDFLRETFNGLNFGSDYSESDTLGMGARQKATLDSIADINRKADSIPDMSGQLGAAKQAYGAAYQTLVDSINHAMGDSVNAWSSQITNNGVLTGSGSNDCPSILTRTWSISFPIGNNGFNVTIPAIGGQLCRPITILGGATFWTLCRVILRMVVAIMCMMWVYRAVIGADSNED